MAIRWRNRSGRFPVRRSALTVMIQFPMASERHFVVLHVGMVLHVATGAASLIRFCWAVPYSVRTEQSLPDPSLPTFLPARFQPYSGHRCFRSADRVPGTAPPKNVAM